MYDRSMFRVFEPEAGGRVFEVIPGSGGLGMGLIGFTENEFGEDDLMLFSREAVSDPRLRWHMCGVLFPIDIHFLDGEGRLIAVYRMEPEIGSARGPDGSVDVIETRPGWFRGGAGERMMDFERRVFYRNGN